MSAPTIDGRDAAAILAALLARRPGYTPGWAPEPGGPGESLLQINARYAELLIAGLDALPERAQLAFLDRLGVSLLPAQAARTPLVFSLLPNSALDVSLPANTQVAAPSPPAGPRDGAAAPPEPVIFATDQSVTLAHARLAALYSIDPGSDSFADHSAAAGAGFTLFDDLGPIEHALYLGHQRLYALAGAADVTLFFELGPQAAPDARRDLVLAWEYLSDDGWLPLEVIEDRTARLTRDGLLLLRKGCGPDSRQETIGGLSGYWIRARVSREPLSATVAEESTSGQTVVVAAAGALRVGDQIVVGAVAASAARSTIVGVEGRQIRLDPPLPGLAPGDLLRQAQPPAGLAPLGGDASAPVIDSIRTQVSFTKRGLAPEAALSDGLTLDTANTFYPFGVRPAALATFYLASKEVFTKRDAEIGVRLELQQAGKAAGGLTLSYEYYNGDSWRSLEGAFELRDGSERLTKDGEIAFRCPLDWAPLAVAGQRSHWLRIRIDVGGYGESERLTINPQKPSEVTLTASTLAPPVVRRVSLRYSFRTELAALDHCLTYNDFRFADHSADCRWPRRLFTPFSPVDDRHPAVYLGFDRPLPAGLLSLYVAAAPGQAPAGAEAADFVWEYASAHGWASLPVLDETLGFRRSGMIQFVGPRDAVPEQGQGGSLYRVRARLKRGAAMRPAPLGGVWLNAVWATQRQSFEREILGASDGAPGQAFRFLRQRVPVLAGEQIEVREWAGQGETWRTAVAGLPDDQLRFERDPLTQAPRAVWVRYLPVPHLFGSGPRDRHYSLERAGGLLRFGDGRSGMIPPAGSPVRATYGSGGGLAGNLPAASISELRAAVPAVMAAGNVAPAAGGAAGESLAAVRARGAARMRHRDRALSADDVAWVAREASPEVALARCLALRGPDGPGQRGWLTVLIVPDGDEPQPQPSPELLRRVQRHLAARVPAPVAGQVRVVGPRYAAIGVQAEVAPRRPEDAATVEALLLERLARFLHPLRGGPEGAGWGFGRPVFQSQVAALIEATPGVDYALRVGLLVDGALADAWAAVDADALAAPGRFELKLTIGEVS